MKIEMHSGDLYHLRAIIGHRLADICDKAKTTEAEDMFRYWVNTYDTTFEVAVNLDKVLLMTKEEHIRDSWATAFPFPKEMRNANHPAAGAGVHLGDPRQLVSH